MAIYEISHIYDKKYFRKDRKVIMVGQNHFDDVICECDLKDNIANKNANYCELTAIYALHKNVFDEYYGIEHYRRFFCNGFGKQISEKEVKKIIKKGNIILQNPIKSTPNNFLFYCVHHYSKDMEIIRDIIISDYKDYFDSFEKIMISNKLSYFNMVICNAKIFHAYCDWLFEILKKFEERIKINDYIPYQARVFGFISERLLNVWVDHNIPKEKIVYRSICQIDQQEHTIIRILKTIKANLIKHV